MPWRALELEADAAHAEAITEALLELGAQAVATEDAEAGSAAEAPRFAEPCCDAPTAWRRNRISALVGLEADIPALVAAAARAAGLGAIPPFRVVRVEDEDWVRRTQAQFGPIRVGEHLWIVPSWCEPPRAPGALVLRLDPGLAFGTGSHPSTRLALAWLERSIRGGERVLDYGCGSGILALAAVRLGAAQASAVDLDPQALEAAAANARANGVRLELHAPEALPPGDYDLIVANILAQPLVRLAPELAARARPGARLALSGILTGQADEVAAAYAAAFETAVEPGEEGWALVTGVRRWA